MGILTRLLAYLGDCEPTTVNVTRQEVECTGSAYALHMYDLCTKRGAIFDKLMLEHAVQHGQTKDAIEYMEIIERQKARVAPRTRHHHFTAAWRHIPTGGIRYRCRCGATYQYTPEGWQVQESPHKLRNCKP